MKHKLSLLLLILLIMVVMSRPVKASPSGTWAPTGSMTIPRLLHTATLLPDTRVLVAGGVTVSGRITAATELYNATSGIWSSTNSMITPRSQHTATLMLDGRVIISGGSFQGTSLSTAEIFDPATDTWISISSMQYRRSNHIATLLPDGRVLVTGGVGGNKSTPVENSAEIYDPQTDTWSTTDHMSNARYNHQATLLMDGKVLVTGGFNVSAFHVALKTVEIYDPVLHKWTNALNMSTPRATHLSFLLQDGRVLVGGGWTLPPNVLTPTASVEIYDPVTYSWIPISNMSLARGAISSGAVLLADGRVLAAGGRDANSFLTTVDVYDPVNGIWSLTHSMGSARSGSHTATVLADGRILVSGGRGPTGSPLSTAEVYTP